MTFGIVFPKKVDQNGRGRDNVDADMIPAWLVEAMGAGQAANGKPGDNMGAVAVSELLVE